MSKAKKNMFPNISRLILSLPLLILAYPPYQRFTTTTLPAGPSLHPSTHKTRDAVTAPTGDTLNRTACFCASPQWVMDQNYGFYYLITYTNAHLNRTFTLEQGCESSLSINIHDKYDPANKPVLQNACLRTRVNDPVKYCTGKDTDRDTFCYTLAGGAEYDSYSFNGQHRTGLPKEPVVTYPTEVVEKVCEESCKGHVGGMEMLKEDALEVLEGYYSLVGQTLKSSVVFYPSIPDMCKDCK